MESVEWTRRIKDFRGGSPFLLLLHHLTCAPYIRAPRPDNRQSHTASSSQQYTTKRTMQALLITSIFAIFSRMTTASNPLDTKGNRALRNDAVVIARGRKLPTKSENEMFKISAGPVHPLREDDNNNNSIRNKHLHDIKSGSNLDIAQESREGDALPIWLNNYSSLSNPDKFPSRPKTEKEISEVHKKDFPDGFKSKNWRVHEQVLNFEMNDSRGDDGSLESGVFEHIHEVNETNPSFLLQKKNANDLNADESRGMAGWQNGGMMKGGQQILLIKDKGDSGMEMPANGMSGKDAIGPLIMMLTPLIMMCIMMPMMMSVMGGMMNFVRGITTIMMMMNMSPMLPTPIGPQPPLPNRHRKTDGDAVAKGRQLFGSLMLEAAKKLESAIEKYGI